MRLRRIFKLPRVGAVLFLLTAFSANAQNFGSPVEEQRRLAEMSADVEKIYQIQRYLNDLRRKRLLEIGPGERASRRVLENWREESDLLTTYIELFSDLHGASVVLINSVALALQIDERQLASFYMQNVCIYMPGKSRLLTTEKIQGDRSVPRRWASFAQETLRPSDVAKVTEGLEIADRLSDSYNRLCDRAMKIDNWKN